MNKALIAVGVLVFSMFCCCAPYSPFADIVTVEKPESAEVLGLYQMTGQNLNKSESFQNRLPVILIEPDGSCKFTDFPVWEQDSSSKYSVKEWLSSEGAWEIIEVGRVSRDGRTYAFWGISCSNHSEEISTSGKFANDKPPYEILFVYDDPDSGIAMTFQKVP